MDPAIRENDSLKPVLLAIGKKLTELRLAKGYPRISDFTSAYDLPRIHYWRMEKGQANLTLKSLHKILLIHDLTIPDLLSQLHEKE
jgi:hypothetical protein